MKGIAVNMKSNICPRLYPQIAAIVFSVLSSLFVCLPLSASQVPTTLPPFATDRDKFIAIARSYIPTQVYERGYFVSGLAGSTIENYVIVTFKISTVTKQELGWQEGLDTKFTHTGYLPQDTFNELQFKIDVASDKLILKEALDRAPIPIIINGPGFTINPSPNPDTWSTIVAYVVLLGGLIALMLGLRRSKRSP